MDNRYRNFIKWAVYAAGFLLTLTVTGTVLGGRTFFGAKLDFVPVYVTCVACREGHEDGGIFALVCSLVWALSGVTGRAVLVLALPAAALISGYFCATYLTRTLLPALGGCLLALVLCEGGVYLERLWLGGAVPPDALRLLAVTIGLSMLSAPILWGLVRLIGRIGKAGA